MDTQLYFEDVTEGMTLPSLEKTPSNTLLFLYSSITWNPQRIHFDKDFTQGEGYRDIVVHGPLRGAFLSQLLTRWIGEQGRLKKLSYANRDIAYVNERLVCTGTGDQEVGRSGGGTCRLRYLGGERGSGAPHARECDGAPACESRDPDPTRTP